jgi:peptidoglycan/xylan/chitin deacetylase (PgdA/CDA1 family)
VALTFDDGPSESTPELLEILARFGVPATFFQCGVHARRLPAVAREVVAAGHEIGNHTEHHARLWLRPGSFLRSEIGEAQRTLAECAGTNPRLFRAPYGVRWPGLGRVQREFGLTGVMWTAIGNDWVLPPRDIAGRVLRAAEPGAIICLHDGRELSQRPDIRATLAAVREIVPRLQDQGYGFRKVGDWVPYV